jgi:hemoglobin
MNTPFEAMGGEPAVRTLVDRFYDLMDELPEATTIRAMHPPDLSESRDKLHWFLCGFFGGPQLYVQRFGHPKLRRRHLPFPIDDAARDAWMTCMLRAVGDEIGDPQLRDQLEQAFARTAAHMRNRGPGVARRVGPGLGGGGGGGRGI